MKLIENVCICEGMTTMNGLLLSGGGGHTGMSVCRHSNGLTP